MEGIIFELILYKLLELTLRYPRDDQSSLVALLYPLLLQIARVISS